MRVNAVGTVSRDLRSPQVTPLYVNLSDSRSVILHIVWTHDRIFLTAGATLMVNLRLPFIQTTAAR